MGFSSIGFSSVWSKDIFTLSKIIEALKELLKLWVIFINIYSIQN